MEIEIKIGDQVLGAELNETETAEAIGAILPIEAKGHTWGDEIYFEVAVQKTLENGVETVQAGDLGYWPPGNALCIFYGPTPASQGDEIRPASAVTVIGRVTGSLQTLKGSRDGVRVTIRKASK